MNGLLSTTYNPAFNLSTEEYLLKHTDKDVFFLYTNSPSIIVGKHQNALAEINFDYTNKNNIPVHRRLSGGGTVYHDENNLNFCFIQTGKKGELVNFEHYSEPVLQALQNLGIDAYFSKRHDIQIDGKKISGNASHVYRGRTIHHGTLLFNSDLSILNKSLTSNTTTIKDKAVKSIRSEVTNISQHLKEDMKYSDFVKYIFNHLLRHYKHSAEISLTKDEIQHIKAVSDKKYNTWQWNYGYSPKYEINKSIRLKNGSHIKSRIKVEKGIITDCCLSASDKLLKPMLDNLSEIVTNQQHNMYLLEDILCMFKSNYLTEEIKHNLPMLFFN